MIIDFPTIPKTTNEKLKEILSSKFSEIAISLQSVLKIASKGKRKGQLIFVSDAPNKIRMIKDKFVAYIVRSIYDQFNDIINDNLFVMHFNELFTLDFIEGVFRQLSPVIDDLYAQYEFVHNKKYKDQLHNYYELMQVYCEYSTYVEGNIFRLDNPQSKQYFEEYQDLKNKVSKEHPRVIKIKEKIEEDYFYRQLKSEIIRKHKERFPEYVRLYNEHTNLFKTQLEEERKIKDKIRDELLKDNLIEIKKEIEKIVSEFVKVISSSIITGKLKMHENFNKC